MIFNTAAKTYLHDLQLFRELGFEPFSITDQKEHFVGRHTFDNGSYVDVYVTCLPAQFYRAEIFCIENLTTTSIETGSGTLSDYWPTFDKIANNMIVIS